MSPGAGTNAGNGTPDPPVAEHRVQPVAEPSAAVDPAVDAGPNGWGPADGHRFRQAQSGAAHVLRADLADGVCRRDQHPAVQQSQGAAVVLCG